MSEFKREDRYIVIKRSDMEDFDEALHSALGDALAAAIWRRENTGKPPLECVVIESDWPEYETVWRMIEARMTGRDISAFYSAPPAPASLRGELEALAREIYADTATRPDGKVYAMGNVAVRDYADELQALIARHYGSEGK